VFLRFLAKIQPVENKDVRKLRFCKYPLHFLRVQNGLERPTNTRFFGFFVVILTPVLLNGGKGRQFCRKILGWLNPTARLAQKKKELHLMEMHM